MYPEEKPCAIWGTSAKAWKASNFRGEVFDSPRAGGKYRLAFEASVDRKFKRMDPAEKARLTTWIVNQYREGVPEPVITTRVVDDVLATKSMFVSEKTARFFQYLLYNHVRVGQEINLLSVDLNNNQIWDRFGNISAWIESIHDEETEVFLRYMDQNLYIDLDSLNWCFKLKFKGWEKLDEYSSSNSSSKQVFVAQWFGGETFKDEMNRLFVDGIVKGIQDSGLNLTPFRIDQKEHNGKICDEIIAEIRRSKLLIADFTCQFLEASSRDLSDQNLNQEIYESIPIIRGGVYYEAGFAHGLEIPVIFTCKRGCESAIHFDTRQYNHILWDTHEDLAEALKQRIRATLNPKLSHL